MKNRIAVLDEINKLEKKLNKESDVVVRKRIVNEILRLERILENIENRVIN